MQTLYESETLTEEQKIDLIKTKYQEKHTMQRIIKHLWDNYYRVNYFYPPAETFPYSYFIEIEKDGTIKELKD